MDEFKLCRDGEFMPVKLPCPPPYSGPYYYYPYENLPLPPEQGNSDFVDSSDRGGAPISSGAVAGIIIIVGFIFFMMCLIALKCRARLILGNLVRVSSRNARNNELAGELLVNSSGDNMLVNIAGGCGLEEKLVSLLPVCEFVGLVQEGKIDGKERQECAVCLSLFEDKEIVRVLPKCHHIFHIQCIDKWFESHANCPLCRERITLQTIQLSFIHSEKLIIDDQQPLLDPAHQNLGHDHLSHHSFNDQHVISSPPRDVCVHSDHARLAASCDPHPHQNIFHSNTASAANNTNNPHTDESADQPPIRAVADHLVNNDQKSAEFTLRVHNIPSIPAVTAESTTYQRDTESEQNEKACNEAAMDAFVVYIGDTASLYVQSNPSAATDRSHGASAHQSRGEAHDRTSLWQRASNKTGDFFYPIRAQPTHAGHDIIDAHKNFFKNPQAKQPMSHDFDRAFHNSHQVVVAIEASPPASSIRKFSLLRKSFSTGSMVESNYGKSSRPVHGEIL